MQKPKKKFKLPNNIDMGLFKKKLKEEKVNKNDLTITVAPDKNCDFCHGEGRVKIITNKIPGMNNVVLGGGMVRLKEFCPKCVLPKANKESIKLKAVEGESFKIALTTDIKEVICEDPLMEKRSIVEEPELEEIKDEPIQKDTPENKG